MIEWIRIMRTRGLRGKWFLFGSKRPKMKTEWLGPKKREQGKTCLLLGDSDGSWMKCEKDLVVNQNEDRMSWFQEALIRKDFVCSWKTLTDLEWRRKDSDCYWENSDGSRTSKTWITVGSDYLECKEPEKSKRFSGHHVCLGGVSRVNLERIPKSHWKGNWEWSLVLFVQRSQRIRSSTQWRSRNHNSLLRLIVAWAHNLSCYPT